MIKRLLLASCVALSAVAADNVIKPVPVTGKIQWVHSYEEGKKLARENRKPMFVVFRCER